jgi:hypothetical protein
MEQVGIEDVEGCSEGIDEASSKERIDKVCLEGIDAGSEDGFKAGRRDGIEGGFIDDAFALATKGPPKRTRTILAAHENLIVADLEESLMLC